jgi:hypothetical protein
MSRSGCCHEAVGWVAAKRAAERAAPCARLRGALESDGVTLGQVVFVAVASGLGSGLLVGLLHMHHERKERMRDRRLAAADEFATAVIGCLSPIRIFLAADRRSDEGAQAARDAVDDVAVGYDDAIARSARVGLLFGASSPTGRAAAALMDACAAAKTELEAWRPDVADARRLRDEATDRLDEFTQAVHAGVVQGWRERFLISRQRADSDAADSTPDARSSVT